MKAWTHPEGISLNSSWFPFNLPHKIVSWHSLVATVLLKTKLLTVRSMSVETQPWNYEYTATLDLQVFTEGLVCSVSNIH